MVTRREFHLTIVVAALAGALAGVVWVREPEPNLRVRTATAQMLSSRPGSFAAVAKRTTPSVVNVFTTQHVRLRPSPFGRGDPFDEFFREFFPQMPQEQERQSLGSGFIMQSDGTIMTNHHVVGSADEIRVKLGDGRSFPARLVGSDPRTDIAVIKIDGQNLPVAELGDSDRLAVGDWVLAIGNPFGLEETVTAGIVSAKERMIGAGPYDDFIQTDASINPGNSGGPLVDAEGRVVGVNNAIYSRTGGSIGIGFAIPINLAKKIGTELREKRRVARGWFGVAMQDVTPELARALGLENATGAIVADIYRGGPGWKGGLRRGDVVVGFEGKEIKTARELTRLASDAPIGSTVSVEVIRGPERKTLKVVIEEPAQQAGEPQGVM
jgi:serine protease Do